ncbi:MAG: hypothetical protein AAGC55_22705, partial [Myxococcota bacterium]
MSNFADLSGHRRVVIGALLALAALIVTSCLSRPYSQCESNLVCPAGYRCSDSGAYCVVMDSEERCGDGIVDGSEACDCGDDESFVDAPAACGDERNSDDAGYCRKDCTIHCGDGVISSDELCDGATLPDNFSCAGLGFSVNHLSCTTSCEGIDITECRNYGWTEALDEDRLSLALFSVSGVSSEEIYVAGSDGALYQFSSGVLTELCPTTDGELRGVQAIVSEEVIAVGITQVDSETEEESGGTIVRYKGEGCVTESSIDEPLRAVWAPAGTSVGAVAVGDRGTIMRYDGNQ